MTEQKESTLYESIPYVYLGGITVFGVVGSIVGSVKYYENLKANYVSLDETTDIIESSIVGGACGLVVGALMGLLSPITVPGLIAVYICKHYK